MKRRNRFVRGTGNFLKGAIAGLAFLVLTPVPGFSSNFSISPTTLDLNGGAKSGVFSVINGGADKLTCQVSVKEWSQDAAGKDVYTETKDIIFFPKIMTVGPNEQRAIRVGMKGPLSAREKTYRLFVEEIPSQQKNPDVKVAGKIAANLTIAFRYAMPIFVGPARRQESVVVDKVDMAGGVAGAVIRNTGNVHVKLLSVTFSGKAADGRELYSKEFSGWYILQGRARSYEATVPRDVCGKLSTIEVRAKSETLELNGNMNVLKKMCLQ